MMKAVGSLVGRRVVRDCSRLYTARTNACMSTLASFPYSPQAPDPDYVLPLAKNGFDPDLNWSLGDDGLTIGGDAFRNASELALFQYSQSPLTKQKVVQKKGNASKVAKLATEEYQGYSLMDADEADYFREQVSEDLYARKRLFVEDAAFGSNRNCEIKVRAVTDTAEANLFFRNMLHRIPLDIPDCFPRHILVISNEQWDKTDPCVLVDIDMQANSATKAVVVAAGKVSFSELAENIAFCANELATKGGYRHEFGGGLRARIARENGRLELYYTDRYWKASPDEPHPDMLLMRGHVLTKTGSAPHIILTENDKVAAKALHKRASSDSASVDLYASNHFFWDKNGIGRAWGGIAAGVSDLGGSKWLPRGTIVEGDYAFRSFDAPLSTFEHPYHIDIAGDTDTKPLKGAEALDLIAQSQKLTEEQVSKLRNIIGERDITARKVKDVGSVIDQL
eukprot:gb/GECG01015420.1/.p1 GENE.gb/GECG01015420.1/~~gb/GECG01015420.1/.p1  ORF type:complete len:452 (+),score=60.95 gb/GECG01015420.1/:1-1356(+)